MVGAVPDLSDGAIMKKYEFRYNIATESGAKKVTGYAIDSDLPIRYCIRQSHQMWVADHYDSGYAIPGRWESFPDAVVATEAILRRNIESGTWAKLMDSIGEPL